MTRERIELSDTLVDVLTKMSDGNPGAISVMTNILALDKMDGFMLLLDLDDMNMRGEQIWVGFKDVCAQDLQSYMKAVRDRSQELIDKVNKECPNHVAVKYGASSR